MVMKRRKLLATLGSAPLLSIPSISPKPATPLEKLKQNYTVNHLQYKDIISKTQYFNDSNALYYLTYNIYTHKENTLTLYYKKGISKPGYRYTTQTSDAYFVHLVFQYTDKYQPETVLDYFEYISDSKQPTTIHFE